MKDMSEYFKYVENKDQRWTGIGLTEKAWKVPRCCISLW